MTWQRGHVAFATRLKSAPPCLRLRLPAQDLVPEVLAHLETLTQHISRAAADILNSMKTRQLQSLLGKRACASCMHASVRHCTACSTVQP